MDKLEKEANELVEKHYNIAEINVKEATRAAIQSLNHTIGVLEKAEKVEKELYGGNRTITLALEKQIKLKKILEDKL
jgi:hypothetical protein